MKLTSLIIAVGLLGLGQTYPISATTSLFFGGTPLDAEVIVVRRRIS